MSKELHDLKAQMDAIEAQISAYRATKKSILEGIKKIESEERLDAIRRENKHLRDMVAALMRDRGQPYKQIAEKLGGVTTERARAVAENGFRYLQWTMRQMEKSAELDRTSKEESE